MKRSLVALLFITISFQGFATDWAWYYVYVQTDYVQGPWLRASDIYKTGKDTYLHPEQFEDLFGSEADDLVNAIYGHLKKLSPARYKFSSTLSLANDTVIMQVNGKITEFDAVRNELVASFTLNGFPAVKIIQQGKAHVYMLKDITVPYMDLVLPGHVAIRTAKEEPVKKTSKDSVPATHTEAPPVTLKPAAVQQPEEEHSHNSAPAWLMISVAANVGLIGYILLRKKR